jgi:hypothetical protein
MESWMQSMTHAPSEYHQSMTDIAKILAQGYMRIEKSRRFDPASDAVAENETPTEASGLSTPHWTRQRKM